MPVNAMAIPWRSQAAMTSSSFTDPPGSTMKRMPAAGVDHL